MDQGFLSQQLVPLAKFEILLTDYLLYLLLSAQSMCVLAESAITYHLSGSHYLDLCTPGILAYWQALGDKLLVSPEHVHNACSA